MPLVPRLGRIFCYVIKNRYSRKDIKRFIKFIKVNRETGCWEWTGSINKDGYGRFKSKCYNLIWITLVSSRVAYELFNGKLIPNKMRACHSCDNPSCVNPNHLWLGTDKDNAEDRDNKGRQVCMHGEDHGMAKLTWVQIGEIRKLHATNKYSQRKLAKIFNITQVNIWRIVNNKIWQGEQNAISS